MFSVNIRVILFTLNNTLLIRRIFKKWFTLGDRPNRTGRKEFSAGHVALLAQESPSVSLANSRPSRPPPSASVHAPHGFTIANQPRARAGDIVDGVDDASGVPAHMRDDHGFFSQSHRRWAGLPLFLPE